MVWEHRRAVSIGRPGRTTYTVLYSRRARALTLVGRPSSRVSKYYRHARPARRENLKTFLGAAVSSFLSSPFRAHA